MLIKPPETRDNSHSQEVKRITSHDESCQEADESGDLSPPRKCLARDECDIITIGIHLVFNNDFVS